jgi:hypothetical protein
MTLLPYAIGFHPGLAFAETVPLTSFAKELIFLEKWRILPLILLEEVGSQALGTSRYRVLEKG